MDNMMLRLVHITDLHIPPLPHLPAGAFSIKRILGYLSWQRKRRYQFERTVFDALLADVRAQDADHIAVTGDLVNLALDQEFERSLGILEALGGPEKVSVIPGNHDAYRKDAARVIAQYWQDYMRGDHGESGFPYLRVRGDVAVIGVNSGVPTPPFMAWGKIDDTQLTALPALLKKAEAENLFKFVLVHHPVTDGVVTARKALKHAERLRGVVAGHGAALVLQGHAHKPVQAEFSADNGETVYVRGAGAASSNGYNMPPAHYHVVDVEKSPSGYDIQVIHRQYDPDEKKFVTSLQENLHF